MIADSFESDSFAWLNNPTSWPSVDGEVPGEVEGTGGSFSVTKDTLIIRPAAYKDFWSKTFYSPPLIKHDACAYLYNVPTEEEVTVKVDFSLTPVMQFDQAGLLLYYDSENWMKCGIEFCDGSPRLSVVVTNAGYSDWSTQQWSQSGARLKVHRIRQANSLVVEAAPVGSEHYEFIRIARCSDFAGSWRIGPFAACPTKQRGNEATFKHFSVSLRETTAHNPDIDSHNSATLLVLVMFVVSTTRGFISVLPWMERSTFTAFQFRMFAAKVQRIERILANRGVGSRTDVASLIRQGKVSVNGRIVRGSSEKFPVDIPIVVAGRVSTETPILLATFKPMGMHCTVGDPLKRRNLQEMFDKFPSLAGYHPVGRLDCDTSGLLLFSKDGDLTQRLLHPSSSSSSNAVEREYEALVTGSVDFEALKTILAQGVRTAEGVHKARLVSAFPLTATASQALQIIHSTFVKAKLPLPRELPPLGGSDTPLLSYVRLAVTEGKYRMVRRLLHNANQHSVLMLVRSRFGALSLTATEICEEDDLAPLLQRNVWPVSRSQRLRPLLVSAENATATATATSTATSTSSSRTNAFEGDNGFVSDESEGGQGADVAVEAFIVNEQNDEDVLKGVLHSSHQSVNDWVRSLMKTPVAVNKGKDSSSKQKVVNSVKAKVASKASYVVPAEKTYRPLKVTMKAAVPSQTLPKDAPSGAIIGSASNAFKQRNAQIEHHIQRLFGPKETEQKSKDSLES